MPATAATPKRYFRKVIRVRAEDSPNVRYALAQRRAGQRVTGEMLVPGVLPWQDYVKRRATWDKIKQCIGLDGMFYEGSEVLLYPADWLSNAWRKHDELRHAQRRAVAIGIDPAEGGDKTAMCAIDEYGIVELVSKKTPDTSVIVGEALAFMRKHGVAPRCVCFDRGGGGKIHADNLRTMGHPVRTVAFGEAIAPDPKRGMRQLREQMENREEHYTFKNRRAQMYGDLRIYLDPTHPVGFSIPAEELELNHQLGLIPLQYDAEGRLVLPPKNKRSLNSQEKSLVEIIGHSPDEADALVLALHARVHTARRVVVGAM